MSDAKKKNTIVVLEPSAKSAKDLLALVEEKGLADVVRVSSVDEAIQLVAQSLPCMFLTSINENADVPTRVQLFKRLEGAIKHQGLKIFVVTPIKNRQLSDMVTQKLGVADYIVEPVPIRTMQFKLNLQLKAVDNFRRQQELKKAAAEAVVIKKLDNGKKAESATGNEVKAQGKPALQAGEDTFLFKNSGVKKAGKKYTVELEGPAPETGEWVPHEDKGDPTPAWRWVPNEEKEAQAKGEIPPDGWVHKGDKPQFNEESQKWAMSSEKPSLSLRKQAKITAEKIGTDEAGEVFVAEDSAVAEENVAKNRAKAALLKKKKEKKSLRGLAAEGADESDEDPGEEAEGGEDGKAGTGKVRRAKSRPKGNKLAGLKDRLGESAEEDAETVLEDKRSGEPGDEATEIKNKVGEDEAPAEFNALKDGGEEATEAKGALGFLKKKKEQLKRAEMARVKGDSLPEGVNPLEESEEAEEGTPKARALKKKKSKSPGDALARLSQSLAAGEEDAGEETDETAAEPAPEADSPTARPSLRLAESEEEREAAEALREDPASKRGELRDRQGSAKKEQLLKERKSIAAQMQALLAEPLAETMSAEEEEQVREELGLRGRPEISAKELARKRRLKNAKSIKGRLSELDDALKEEEAGEAVGGAVSQDAPEPSPLNVGDLSEDKPRGIRGAIDNGETADEIEEERKRLKAKHESERKKAANKDKAIYIPEAEIQPIGNAWESTGTHYVYLGPTVRYKGFDKLEDLLPLWFFEGDDAPALLDKTKQWRFLGLRPVLASTVSEIPALVRDFLIGLRDQVAKGGEGTKERKKQALAALLEDDAAEASGESESNRDSPTEDFGAKNEDDEASGENAEDPGSGKSRKRGGDRNSRLDELKASLDAEEGSDGDGVEASSEDAREESEGEAESQGDEDVSKKDDEDEADPMERLRAKMAQSEAEAKDSYSDKLSEQLGSQSEGVQKFLEKRKKKAEQAGESEATARPAAAPAPGYLGVFVALSDAYANQTNPALALSRVLTSMQDSFRNCSVYCTSAPDAEGRADVLYHPASVAAPTEKLSLAAGLSEPVKSKSGEGDEVLGYLFMAVQGEREAFTDAEEKTFRSMASKIWPLFSQARGTADKEAA